MAEEGEHFSGEEPDRESKEVEPSEATGEPTPIWHSGANDAPPLSLDEYDAEMLSMPFLERLEADVQSLENVESVRRWLNEIGGGRYENMTEYLLARSPFLVRKVPDYLPDDVRRALEFRRMLKIKEIARLWRRNRLT